MDNNEKAIAFCALQINLGKIKLDDIKSEELKEKVQTYIEVGDNGS